MRAERESKRGPRWLKNTKVKRPKAQTTRTRLYLDLLTHSLSTPTKLPHAYGGSLVLKQFLLVTEKQYRADASLQGWNSCPRLLVTCILVTREKLVVRIVQYGETFGPKVWNDIDKPLKNLSYRGFKRELKAQYIISYNSDN